MKATKKKVARGLTSHDCVVALRGRFSAPEFAFFEQVANGTGYGARSWSDAIAFGIWPSRGLLIHGFEVKVGRGDWLKELKTPSKSEAVQKFCDRWWIVAPKGMIETSELPATWGLIDISEKGKCYIEKEAPPLESEPPTKQFVAAILRRHHEVWSKALAAEHVRGVDEGAKNGAGDIGDKLERVKSQLENLCENVEKFEKASGVNIRSRWELDQIGDAVRVLTSARHTTVAEELERDAKRYEMHAKRLRTDIAKLKIAEVV